MKIEKRNIGDAVVIEVSQRVGEVEAAELQQGFAGVFAEGCYKLAIDLSNVDFMTSSGLGAIMSTIKETRANDGFVKIVNPQPLIMDILRTTKLTKVFPVCSTVEEALQHA